MPTAMTLDGPRHTFPNDPILTQLLYVCKSIPGTIIHDDAHKFEADYSRILGDILQLRHVLLEHLPQSALNEHGMLLQEWSSICVLTPRSYKFIIAFFSILSLGGACAPLASGVLPEEAQYFLEMTRSKYMLIGSDLTDQVSKIQHYMEQPGRQNVTAIPITLTKTVAVSPPSVEIDSQIKLSPTLPSLILFTSGTTALPKGVVLPRQSWYINTCQPPGVVILSCRPPHWIAVVKSLIISILRGGKVDILGSRLTPEAIWECIRNGRITHIPVTPNILRQLKDHFQQSICNLPQIEQKEYVAGLKCLRAFRCAGAALEPSLKQFWKELHKDIFIQNMYGSTEAGGAVTKTSAQSQLENSIGYTEPGVIIKLSEGDHGEILFKSPFMFTHYLDNEAATKAAFDENGFFKTGDLAHRVGDEYVFDGRAATYYVLFSSFRISILELENALLDLPYISEAHVLAVPDHEVRELPAALVRIKGPALPPVTETKATVEQPPITLEKIRTDLTQNLPLHKLPVLLRVLQKGEEVTRTASDKAIKKGLVQQYFGISGYLPRGYSMPRVEYWGNQLQAASEIRPWDWCGMQRSS